MRRLMRYVIKRLLLAVPTLLALSLIVFSTIAFLPIEQRLMLYIEPGRYKGSSSENVKAELIAKYHLNDPFIVQWIEWLGQVAKGDLGYSWLTKMPVMKAISLCFAATLEIVMYSAPIIIFVGYKLGVLLAKRAHKRAPHGDAVDKIIRVASAIGYSTPAFIVGLFLLVISNRALHWLPIGRLGLEADIFVYSSKFTKYTGLYTIDALLNGQLWIFFDALQHLVLPVLTLTITVLPIITRITRASMMGELSKPYVFAARAKGLNEKEVVDHAKKPSLFAILTISGMVTANLLTGVVVVEYIFDIKGLGYWLVNALWRWDYQLIVGISILSSVIFVITNLIVDVAYAYLDPRVKP